MVAIREQLGFNKRSQTYKRISATYRSLGTSVKKARKFNEGMRKRGKTVKAVTIRDQFFRFGAEIRLAKSQEEIMPIEVELGLVSVPVVGPLLTAIQKLIA